MTSVIVTGDRKWVDRLWIESVLRGIRVAPSTQVMHLLEGCAPGADMIAHTWGNRQKQFGGKKLVHHHHEAEWGIWGKSAGPRRNLEMLEHLLTLPAPHIVLAFHDNLKKSKGTNHMVTIAQDRGVMVRYHSHLWKDQ